MFSSVRRCEPAPPCSPALSLLGLTSCGDDDAGASASTVADPAVELRRQGPGHDDDASRPSPDADADGRSAGRAGATSSQSIDDVPYNIAQHVRRRPRRAAQLQRVGRGRTATSRASAARCASRRAPSSSTRRTTTTTAAGDGDDDRRHRPTGDDDRRTGRRRPVRPDVRGRGRRRPARDHAQVRHHARAAQRGQRGDARTGRTSTPAATINLPPPADCTSAVTATTAAG